MDPKALVFEVEDVLRLIRHGIKRFTLSMLDGAPKVKLAKSMRLKLFATKGVVCAKCGIVGTHFLLEQPPGSEQPHFALYAGDVLMTKDHIKPHSKGGSHGLSNLQPMCSRCNCEKGDAWDEQGVVAA